ncbi:deoxynucleotide monophosphate kinase family protein [Paenochrobactrum pullorum]|uniref:deoxynucleotide monophosphate kinase family protein n=1 Tax=Paenochrobactrum pullorum TaxID=1324351 RepID=UPI0035BC8742
MNNLALETFGELRRYVAVNDNAPRVIALTGLAGSGKSTASAYLQSKGYRLTKFASPLKDMLRAIGYSEAEIEGHLKEAPRADGYTPRHAMQTLGTEWGRNCMGQNFWVNIWKERASSGLIVVDDCRFPNEADAVRSLGGTVIRLEGRGGIAGRHVSEAMDFEPDCVISNDGSIAELYERLARLLQSFQRVS